ncbi:putative leucine-rich repeat domain, L domain-containing protein [Heracleum sosnowskyi]|uniref:Leucine-rich repeat domain, L domain-containing protein n=1 Tax=Heracleum sosnowskyi TaxID=360622 RepID=A0AAD8N0S2_9APIA|nr:putative leucine-rich repeat domain, L domain-containing protein [Heracleum sosnowskyi]
MEESKWENLNLDCVVNVFGRLDLESLVLDVPLVCKKWHQALANPLCWQKLVFPVDISQSPLAVEFDASGRSLNISQLIKFVVDRSQGFCNKIVLPVGTTIADLLYVSDVCPNLKTLVLPTDPMLGQHGNVIAELIAKWKSLEVLECGNCSYMEKMIENIGLHCKNFVGLSLAGADFDHKVSLAIVSELTNIKSLVLDRISIEAALLNLILGCCKGLELLCIRDCKFMGFDSFDDEVHLFVSAVKDFKYEGNTTFAYDILDSDEEGIRELVSFPEQAKVQESILSLLLKENGFIEVDCY